MRATFEKVVPFEDASFKLGLYVNKLFPAPWHYHPELELTWIMSSHGMRLAGDSVEPFEAGDLVLLGANLPHCWINSTEWRDGPDDARSLVLQFREDLLGPDFAKLPETRELDTLYIKALRGLVFSDAARDELTERLHRLYDTPSSLGRMAQFLTLLSRLSELADGARPLSTEGFVPALNHGDGARIDRIVRFVEENYGRPIALREAAGLAHMSASAFSRYFRAKIGKSFIRFVNELRVSHACRLLIEGDLSITEICFACGYENISNFNRRFRQVRALSPRDFRRASQV